MGKLNIKKLEEIHRPLFERILRLERHLKQEPGNLAETIAAKPKALEEKLIK